MEDLLETVADLHEKVESLTDIVALLMKERKPEPDKPIEALAPKPEECCWACGQHYKNGFRQWLETTYNMPTPLGITSLVTVRAGICSRLPCLQRALEFARENKGVEVCNK
jgi:hypothetical protein